MIRYTDSLSRERRQYVDALHTDIRETFRRVQREQKATTTPCVFDVIETKENRNEPKRINR